MIDRVKTGTRDSFGLGRDLGDAAAGGHVRLWSPIEGEEVAFERSGLAGNPASSAADRTFHVAVQNHTATKLDYYVRPAVRQDVRLNDDGSAAVRTTIVVDNQAPPADGPSYQLGPDQFTRRPGEYWAWLTLWGPEGSVQRRGISESGLVLSHHVMAVAPRSTREYAFETTIPDAVRDGELTLRIVPQPVSSR